MAKWFSVTYVKTQDLFHDDCVAVPKKVWKKENTKWFFGICGKLQTGQYKYLRGDSGS